MGTEIINLGGDGVEVDVVFGGELRTVGSEGGFRGAGKNFKVIVAEWAHAHDFDAAIGFNGEIGLDFEGDFDAGGILRIDADTVHAPDFGSSGVADAGAGLNATSESDKCMVGVSGAAEGATDGENCADQDRGGNENEKTDERLFAFRIHNSLPLLQRSSGATTFLG